MNTHTPNRRMLRWMIVIQEYRDYTNITHRHVKLHKNADTLSGVKLSKSPENSFWDPENIEKEVPEMGINIGDLDQRILQWHSKQI